jgi:hypothetical protein
VLDLTDNVYTIGSFSDSVDFDPGSATYVVTSKGDLDTYVRKLDGAGNFVWATAWGGVSTEFSNALAVDGQGNVYSSGAFADTVDFDPGAGVYNLGAPFPVDLYVHKMSQIAIGLEEVAGPDIVVYPNPAGDRVTILYDASPGTASIEILDGLGRVMLTTESVFSPAQIALPEGRGICMVRVTIDGRSAVRRILRL